MDASISLRLKVGVLFALYGFFGPHLFYLEQSSGYFPQLYFPLKWAILLVVSFLPGALRAFMIPGLFGVTILTLSLMCGGVNSLANAFVVNLHAMPLFSCGDFCVSHGVANCYTINVGLLLLIFNGLFWGVLGYLFGDRKRNLIEFAGIILFLNFALFFFGAYYV